MSRDQELQPPSPHPDDGLFVEFEQWQQYGGELPPLLTRRLGDEGSELVRGNITADSTGDEVLQIFIPRCLKRLLEERAEQAQYHTEDLALLREEHAREVGWLKRRADGAVEAEEHAWQEWERMKLEVSEAQAREAALRELLEGMLRK